MMRVLIVGAGDVAQRLSPLLRGRFRVYALVRQADAAPFWRTAGATPLRGDLDDRRRLRRIGGWADWVIHLAPPPNAGDDDPRTQRLLARLLRPGNLAQPPRRRLTYVSTSGVYGDCAGAQIDETRRLRPESARAQRRVAAEQRLRAAGLPVRGRNARWRVSLLRAPGIYAVDRLPVERLRAGTPGLLSSEDVYTNHIHADDLARAVVAAFRRGRSNRVYHASDDSGLKMSDYFDHVAAAVGLPPPPRLTRAEVRQQLSPLQWSFMRESRRLSNQRLKSELALNLRYPTVDHLLATLRAPHADR